MKRLRRLWHAVVMESLAAIALIIALGWIVQPAFQGGNDESNSHGNATVASRLGGLLDSVSLSRSDDN